MGGIIMDRYYNDKITERRGGKPSVIQIEDMGVLDSVVVRHNGVITSQKELIYVRYSIKQQSFVAMCDVSIFNSNVVNILPMTHAISISKDVLQISSSYTESPVPQRKELINVLTHYYKILIDERALTI
jgi:hypothetical protein